MKPVLQTWISVGIMSRLGLRLANNSKQFPVSAPEVTKGAYSLECATIRFADARPRHPTQLSKSRYGRPREAQRQSTSGA